MFERGGTWPEWILRIAGIGASILIIVGVFLPWFYLATPEETITISGTSLLGWFMLAAGSVGLVGAVPALTGCVRTAALTLRILLGLLATALSIYVMGRAPDVVLGAAKESGIVGGTVQVGYGLIFCGAGSALLVAVGIAGVIRGE